MTARTGKPTTDRERWPFRMKDLCELTGLDRQTIHFYISKGLVPEGHKTGRNMAYYGAEHLERIRLIRELKHERFLPLDAIRAVLDGQDEDFTPQQRALLVEVKERVGDVLRDARAPAPGGERQPSKPIAVEPLLRKHGVELGELRKMDEHGLLSLIVRRGKPHVPPDDVWLIELWGNLRAAGFSSERGFEIEDLMLYAEAIADLFRREVRALTPRLAVLPAAEVAELFRRGLPLINAFLARFHTAKARVFFAAID